MSAGNAIRIARAAGADASDPHGTRVIASIRDLKRRGLAWGRAWLEYVITTAAFRYVSGPELQFNT